MTNEHIECRPSETVVFALPITQNGLLVSGLSPLVTIFDEETGVDDVTDSACAEISTDGVYYYSYTAPAVECNMIAKVFVGSNLIKTFVLHVQNDALGHYAPGSVVRFTTPLVQNGIPVTGASLTVRVYKLSDRTRELNGVAADELAATGFYYYEHTLLAVENMLLVMFFSGSTLINSYYVISRTEGGGGTTTYPSVATINTAIARIAAEYGIAASTYTSQTAELVEVVNQAIQEIQYKLGVLKTDFSQNILNGVHRYRIDNAILFPFTLESVWYATGSNEHSLMQTSREVTRAYVNAGNTVISRYAEEKSGMTRYIQLDGVPAADITGGLRIVGPYIPADVTSSDLLPLLARYRFAVIAIGVALLVEQYIPNLDVRKFARTLAEVELAKLSQQGGIEINAPS